MELIKKESSTKYAWPTVDIPKQLKNVDSVRSLSRSHSTSVQKANKALSKEKILNLIKESSESIVTYKTQQANKSVSVSIELIQENDESMATNNIKANKETNMLQEINEVRPPKYNILFQNIKLATENNPSMLQLASKFVDGIIDESLKKLDKKVIPKIEQEKSDEILRRLFSLSNMAQRDHPALFNMAKNFIDTILHESVRRTANIKLLGVDRFQRYYSPNDFKIRDGLELITRCISKWLFNQNWYFKIIYNGRSISDSHSYFYTVKLSVPTLAYPIAQVTVDVYFTIEVFYMIPPPVHIEVWYRLETDRLQHSAFSTTLLEKWVCTVVKQKLKIFQLFKF